ncbi:MAG: phosphoribosylamine--glycine ligase [Armatimonadota bacterium]
MKVLVLGGGGREHALAWRLSQSESVSQVVALPGNPGIGECARLIPGDPNDPATVVEAAKSEGAALVVVGPEAPLIAGVADKLREAGIDVFGPVAAAAQIEGSKAFAKQLMQKVGVPTAQFGTFAEIADAEQFIREMDAQGRKIVVKASGAALGKGAIVCDDADEAVEAARRMLVAREFGEAGEVIVVEERLTGRELSLFALCNGEEYVLLPCAQDYKRAEDGDKGPNTGGMGAFSPVEDVSNAQLEALGRAFIAPIVRHFRSKGTPYVGVLYAGLMMTPMGPFALEYNARFGDPEAQAILPRLRGDLGALLVAAARGERLSAPEVDPRHSVVVVVAARGYPGTYRKGLPLPNVSLSNGILLFHAGTQEQGGKVVSSGGRVLNVVALADSREEAARSAYASLEGLSYDWHFRRDIGAAPSGRASG